MNVGELKAQLEGVPDRKMVVVPVETKHATIGGTPRAAIVRAFSGFDWDSSCFFLQPDQPVTLMSEEDLVEVNQFKALIGSLRGNREFKELSNTFIRKDTVMEILEAGFAAGFINSSSQVERMKEWVEIEKLEGDKE